MVPGGLAVAAESVPRTLESERVGGRAGGCSTARVEGNRMTAARRAATAGGDGLWYLFTKQFSDWMLSAPPSADPAELLGRS